MTEKIDTRPPTPNYDRLVARFEALKAARGDRPMHPAESALRKAASKAITSGQRAGERAVANVHRPYEFTFASLTSEERIAITTRAMEAAGIASARARDRYAAKVLATFE